MTTEIKTLIEKNLAVSAKKPVINIVFVGTVDAGKSTICGRFFVDNNMVDERIVEKYKKEAEEINRSTWYLAWIMDTGSKEREKGKTQELGVSNSMELKKVVINILDAPGHRMLIADMIEGASRADIGILVVSARKNEFETGFTGGGQTKEHVRLLRAGNCKKIMVLVNKMDDCNWSKERFEYISDKIGKFVSFSFKESKIIIIPVSGYKGGNIVNKETSATWYTGPTFYEYLNNTADIEQENEQIDEKIDESILTVVEVARITNVPCVYVKVEKGIIYKNTSYTLLPYLDKKDKIISIYDDEDIDVEITRKHDVYRIKLDGLSNNIQVGHKLVYPNELCNDFACSSLFLTEIGVYDVLTAITVGFCFILYCNLQVVEGKITHLYDFETKKQIRMVKRGQKALVKIMTKSPLVVTIGKNYKDKFSIRHNELTIAIGTFLKQINK